MLAPHDGKYAKLGDIRFSAQRLFKAVVFIRAKPVLFYYLGSYFCVLLHIDSNTLNPSIPPSNASLERSGCGIIPRTLPRSFTIPAILSIAPFGFSSYLKTI